MLATETLTPTIRATLDALRRAQAARATTCAPAEQWVAADLIRVELPADLRAGVGARLAALERRGLAESMCDGASWDLTRKYNVVWRAA